LRDALTSEWELLPVAAPAASDGDGGSGSPQSVTAARGAEIYLGYGVPAGVVAAGKGTLRWAHSGTAGIGASLASLRGSGIVLTNSAGIHAEPIADWVIAAIGYFARGLDCIRDAQAAGHWAKTKFTDLLIPVREFRDVRVGIVGLGGIGSAVARRALALQMPVAGVRRRPERGGPPGTRWVGPLDQLPRLAGESDCLVITAPHTNETAGAVSRSVLQRLPAGAVVVNVSRAQEAEGLALRLFDRLRKHLQETGVELFWNAPAHAATVTEGRCTRILLKSAGREQPIEARAYVLALEDWVDGALRAGVHLVRDPFFGRVIADHAVPSQRTAESIFGVQPYAQLGYPVTDRLQPADETGRPLADNVFVAGGAIAGYDPSGTKSRGGMAIATGYRAAMEAMAAA